MATSHGGLGRILPGSPLGVRIRRVAADKTLTNQSSSGGMNSLMPEWWEGPGGPGGKGGQPGQPAAPGGLEAGAVYHLLPPGFHIFTPRSVQTVRVSQSVIHLVPASMVSPLSVFIRV